MAKKQRRRSVKDWRPGGEHLQEDPRCPEMLRSYLGTALWSTPNGETGGMFDETHSIEDFADEAVDKAHDDIDDFVRANLRDLEATGASDSRNGHDFWLTRNRHGAGFWDRNYGAVGERLTEAAQGYGEQVIFEGDDGRLYFGG